MTAVRRLLLVVVLLVGAACSSDAPSADRTTSTTAQPLVYLAVGASETIGVGADTPAEQAWTAVLFRTLPNGSTFVNAGVGGSTVAAALTAQAPKADEVDPDLVTVWLNVNDILRLVPTATYEQQLTDLVRRLRRGGDTKVLVANTPDVSRLPIVTSCLTPEPPPGQRCAVPAFLRGPGLLDLVNGAVAEYNAAIGRVVAAEGAVLVDLHAASLEQRAAGTEASLVSGDGFHPSTAGHAAVAATFAKVLAAA